MERGQTTGDRGSMADVTAERVHAVIAAAEVAAAAIIADAEAEADRIRAAARAESDETVNAANLEATGRVEQARGAVEGLIAQADNLRVQVGALGKDLASNLPGSPTPADSPDPEVVKTGPDGQSAQSRAEEPRAAAAAGDGDGAARLVAMNMALDGASRAEIEGRLEADFPPGEDREALLDDVLSRAGR